MKRTELRDYIGENGLLTHVNENSGIYAITIDNNIVYIGQSQNMYQRCSEHIYKTQNAMLIKEQKYLLLLSAQLGGHNIDCYSIENCAPDNLNERERYYIEEYKPCLNILVPGARKDISNLKIEDVLRAPIARVEIEE